MMKAQTELEEAYTGATYIVKVKKFQIYLKHILMLFYTIINFVKQFYLIINYLYGIVVQLQCWEYLAVFCIPIAIIYDPFGWA